MSEKVLTCEVRRPYAATHLHFVSGWVARCGLAPATSSHWNRSYLVRHLVPVRVKNPHSDESRTSDAIGGIQYFSCSWVPDTVGQLANSSNEFRKRALRVIGVRIHRSGVHRRDSGCIAMPWAGGVLARCASIWTTRNHYSSEDQAVGRGLAVLQ